MKRFRGKELHERPWFPRLWRDELTEFLSFFARHSGVYRPALDKIAAFLRDPEIPAVYTDLCAGAGGYELGFVRKLRKLTGRGVQARLTDLYPNAHWEKLAALGQGGITAVCTSLPASQAVADYEGCSVMFSGLHHFDPEELRNIITIAAKRRRTLVFCDYSRRSVAEEFLPMLFAVPFMIVTAPLVWPFSWKRLLFTWVLPVLPLLLWIDGWLSRLRAYHPDELRKIVAELELPSGTHWEVVRLPVFFHIGEVTCLTISPKMPEK